MTTILLNLLWIHLIVILVFHSGFIDSVDGFIHRKWKPYHLPKPFSCALCSVFWTSVIYLLIAHYLTLPTIVLSLTSAVLTTVTAPLLKTIENGLMKIIELINRII